MHYSLKLLLPLWALGHFLVFGQAAGFTEQELGFSPGEIRLIESPDKENIRPFAVPTFRDLLRLGHQRVYFTKKLDRTEYVNTGLKRKELDFSLRQGLIQYFRLVHMEAAKNTIDLDKIRKSFRPGPALEDTNSQYAKSVDVYWAIVLKEMGAYNFKPEEFSRFFCAEQKPCLPLHMPNSSGAYQQKMRQAIWGGRSGEFAEMKAFNDFMDTYAKKFIQWSADKGAQEVYFVGKTGLGEYDFNAGGFVLKNLNAQSGGAVTIEYKSSKEDSLFKPNYTPEGQMYQSGILISMSAEKAEALLNRLKAEGRSRQIYFVYKARIIPHFSDIDLANFNFHMMIRYTQEPVSRTIEFFSDDALTDKVFEISN
ncbi:MAG: hypothetical protein ABF293_05225 [Flavobacteriaceae bacterium]